MKFAAFWKKRRRERFGYLDQSAIACTGMPAGSAPRVVAGEARFEARPLPLAVLIRKRISVPRALFCNSIYRNVLHGY